MENTVNNGIDSVTGKVAETISSNTGITFDKPPKTTAAKLDVIPDLSSMTSHDGSIFSALGDNISKKNRYLPQLRNITDIKAICSIPTHIGTTTLTTTADSLLIAVDPLIDGTHASYIAKCFKYYRADTKLFFHICCSPLVSGRLRITLYPVESDDYATPNAFGDVPTWIVSVKGPTTWALGVPYLQIHPWQETVTKVSNLQPRLKIELDGDLSQPFDKTCSITVHSFISAGDIEFAGLQSCSPATNIAEFQSVHMAISAAPMLGSSEKFPYMGGVTDIMQMISRFSSRVPKPQTHYPFPLAPSPTVTLADIDNFDYLSYLYLFYNGDTNIKMVFSKAPTDGVIKSGIRNSFDNPLASPSFKSGNSIVATHQAVWPVLELIYPYQNEVEFDSAYFPRAMYTHVISEDATMAEFYIAPAQNFKLHYLLPVPATFQSFDASFQSVLNATLENTTYRGMIGIQAGLLYKSYTLTPLAQDSMCLHSLQATCRRTSGTVNQGFILSVGKTSITTPPVLSTPSTNVIVAVPLTWTDVSNSGVNMCQAKAKTYYVPKFATTDQPLYLNIVRTTSDTTAEFDFDVVYTQSGISGAIATVSPFDGDAYTNSVQVLGAVQAEVIDPVMVRNSPSDPFVVELAPVESTIPVAVQNSVTTSSTIVGQTANLLVEVMNTEPIPVSLEGTEPLEITGRVQGVLAPDTPVYTTHYF